MIMKMIKVLKKEIGMKYKHIMLSSEENVDMGGSSECFIILNKLFIYIIKNI